MNYEPYTFVVRGRDLVYLGWDIWHTLMPAAPHPFLQTG